MKLLENKGGKAFFVKADTSNAEDHEKLVKKRWKNLDNWILP